MSINQKPTLHHTQFAPEDREGWGTRWTGELANDLALATFEDLAYEGYFRAI